MLEEELDGIGITIFHLILFHWKPACPSIKRLLINGSHPGERKRREGDEINGLLENSMFGTKKGLYFFSQSVAVELYNKCVSLYYQHLINSNLQVILLTNNN